MRISQKLILGFITIALLVAVVGFVSIRTSQKALQDSIGKSSATLVDNILGHIDRTIYRRLEAFQEYSRDAEIIQSAQESNKEFEKLPDIQAYITEKDQQWTSVPRGQVTGFMQEITSCKISEKLRNKVEFYENKYGYKVFGEIFITNKYGANIAQTRKTSDYYQADEQWWQNAKNRGSFITDVQYDISAGVYSTDICTRIEDDSGNFLGVMKVVLNIDEAINLIKEAEKAGKFKLLTKDGKVIYSTEEFKFFGSISEELLSYLNRPETHDSAHYFITADDSLKHREKLIAHAHSKGYKDYEGLGWSLMVEHKAEDMFADAAQIKKLILISTTAIAALAILFGLLISKAISRPISKLTTAAKNIGSGNLNTRVDIELNDEIGRLSESFNKMVNDLKKTTTSIDTLNSEIAERERAQSELRRGMEQLEQCAQRGMERQEQVIKLKREVNELLAALGREPKYMYTKNLAESIHHSDDKEHS
ncbi:MAG: HAMP domain-containing protein [Sedimentisphaerales bacterium]|nr:HAMP domain-containing protein [Sedimentisphaerales bacterium]